MYSFLCVRIRDSESFEVIATMAIHKRKKRMPKIEPISIFAVLAVCNIRFLTDEMMGQGQRAQA